MDECLNESMCREALFRLVAECTPRMTCCLCGKFFSSPHTFQVCSHTFCWDCIISTLEGPGVTASRCPACHIPGWKKDLHKNCTYEKVVDALKVAGQALDAPGGGHGLGALGHGVLGQEETSGQHEALGAADDEHGEAASGSGSDSDCEPEPVPTAEAEARVGVGNGAGMDVDMDARTGVGVSVPAPTAGEGALLAADLAVVSAWLAEGERIRAARQAALGRPGGVAGMLA
ncbi:hypothetical protein FOA52_013505 [Chlamydomonas sp. UWO 241]|nr:hypothetical protein FOA52_013505 [Chlamydomonas sp. UWO 241]